jgi:hypothetical protein
MDTPGDGSRGRTSVQVSVAPTRKKWEHDESRSNRL